MSLLCPLALAADVQSSQPRSQVLSSSHPLERGGGIFAFLQFVGRRKRSILSNSSPLHRRTMASLKTTALAAWIGRLFLSWAFVDGLHIITCRWCNFVRAENWAMIVQFWPLAPSGCVTGERGQNSTRLWNAVLCLNWTTPGLGLLETTPGGVLSIMAYTGRLRPKGVPFPGFRYIKG